MSNFGRPTKDAVTQRRRLLKVFLVNSTAASEEAVKRIADRLQVGEKAVRADLEAIKDEFEHAPSDELSAGLEQAIVGADTFASLKRLGKKVMTELVKGSIDRGLGTALVEAIKEQRQLLVREREEKTEASILALEILTPEEDELLRGHRAKLAGAPLKPGEAVPPPSLPAPEERAP